MAKSVHHSHHRGADHLTVITVMGLTVLLLWGEVSRVEAGGCSRFGHSCFGAHGKRAEIPAGFANNVDPMLMIAPVANSPVGPSGPGIPIEIVPDGYNAPNLLPLSNTNSRMSPYMLEWILSAHRGDNRQAPSSSADDVSSVYRRK